MTLPHHFPAEQFGGRHPWIISEESHRPFSPSSTGATSHKLRSFACVKSTSGQGDYNTQRRPLANVPKNSDGVIEVERERDTMRPGRLFTASSASFVNLVTHRTTWIPSKPPPSPMRSSEIKYLRSWIYTELWESASCFSSKAHWGAVPRKRKTSSAIRECRRWQKCNVLSHRRTWYIQNNVSFFSLTLLYVGFLITWSHFPPRHVRLCSYGLALALSARS